MGIISPTVLEDHQRSFLLDQQVIIIRPIPIVAETKDIKSLIYVVRGQQVMLDSDLAMLYQVETKVFNQAVSRNIERFPENFRFQLTKEEFDALRSQIATSNGRGGRRYRPYMFTEQGIAMLSGVLRSDVAVQVSIEYAKAKGLPIRYLEETTE